MAILNTARFAATWSRRLTVTSRRAGPGELGARLSFGAAMSMMSPPSLVRRLSPGGSPSPMLPICQPRAEQRDRRWSLLRAAVVMAVLVLCVTTAGRYNGDERLTVPVDRSLNKEGRRIFEEEQRATASKQTAHDPSPVATSCADKRHECPRWAALGECDANPHYMHHSCSRACGRCAQEAS